MVEERPKQRLDPPPDRMDRAGFVARFGGIYEHSPWVAEAVFDAGLPAEAADPDVLAGAMARQVEAAPYAARLALLRAHPDLAGRLAVAGALTEASRSEQAGAGLDRCSEAEFAEFTRLNAAYREKFGFPFILAVRGHDRHSILAAFRQRVESDAETEFRTALDQVHRIALMRLRDMAGGAA
ncbi:MAG: 2-oxo-4-hydroxy-4-carboxy-5-ureidoimidazoline decarboxylase [Alphaproteobacteria bacterium]|nr:MAG: 2-oxo-4-hydroxy-4-carboxy-5-ureidoimidazoline decarboxylase [Alphaproteobacteria bacterium]